MAVQVQWFGAGPGGVAGAPGQLLVEDLGYCMREHMGGAA
jgi:hypothetical protein